MAENCPNSISTAEKPTKHISVHHWIKNVRDIQRDSEDQHQNSFLQRNETRMVRNETEIKSDWARHKTNVLLADRIAEEQQWIQILHCTRNVLDTEAGQLEDEKTKAEEEIESYLRAISVVSECRLVRDRRLIRDLTYDDPHDELHNELKLLETNKVQLTENCHEAWKLFTSARQLSSNIADNLKDKTSAMTIDCNTLELNPDSPLITHKPDVLQIRSDTVPHESWLQTAQALQGDAETLTSQMVKHHEKMKLMREQARMAYLSQVEATNFALRKRIYNANKLKNELEWQKKNTIEEMARVQEEIDRLRVSEADHVRLLKCAETRQEDRNIRPTGELVHDNPHDALLEEIIQLRQNLSEIRNNCDNSMVTFNRLEALANKLSNEIASKEVCIQMEMRSLDARSNLLQHDPVTRMDNEAVLVKMEKQIAPAPLN